jgi:hypothetical protein
VLDLVGFCVLDDWRGGEWQIDEIILRVRQHPRPVERDRYYSIDLPMPSHMILYSTTHLFQTKRETLFVGCLFHS